MISVIVPVLNEAENIEPLISEIVAVAKLAPVKEIVYIDDASTDETPAILKKMMQDVPMLKVVRHASRCGQSAAFRTGAAHASQPLLVFMDGDGQNDPADIALLYATYEANVGEGIMPAVLGQREKRNDNWLRRFSSRTANKIRASLLKDGTRDTGCSLKLIPRAAFLELPYFDHMHRFLPALLQRDGVKLTHVDVSHRARMRGVSKYGFWGRLSEGVVDLLGVYWLCRRAKPARFAFEEQSAAEKRKNKAA
ncbi:MAG: glycosyltransferase family 2 protein [Pseudobdellovibrionaceae bacterium]